MIWNMESEGERRIGHNKFSNSEFEIFKMHSSRNVDNWT